MNGRLPDEFRDRTKRYAAEVIRLFVKLPKAKEEVRVLGKRCYARAHQSRRTFAKRACRARSNDEFVAKLGGALQEADESLLWLELLREECGVPPAAAAPLERESSELVAIFTTMVKRTTEK